MAFEKLCFQRQLNSHISGMRFDETGRAAVLHSNGIHKMALMQPSSFDNYNSFTHIIDMNKIIRHPCRGNRRICRKQCPYCQYNYSLLRDERSFRWPPRIREICRPLLNAWLKSIRVWNSETNGNQARNATGVNKSKPIMIS